MALLYTTQFPLRFCDTDALGHINNATYSVLYEAGRTDMLAELGLLDKAGGFSPVIARIEIDFLREMNWPGVVTVQTAVHRVGNKSFHLRQRAMLGGELASRAASVMAVIDINTRRAVVLHDAWRAAMLPYVDEAFG